MTRPKGTYPFRHTGKVRSHGDGCDICHNHNPNKSKAKRLELQDIQDQLDDMPEELGQQRLLGTFTSPEPEPGVDRNV